MIRTTKLSISLPEKQFMRIVGNGGGFVDLCAELLNMAYGESPLGWDMLLADDGAGLDKGSICCLIYRVPDIEARSRHSAQTTKIRPPCGKGTFLRIDPDERYGLRLSGSTDGLIRLSMTLLDIVLRNTPFKVRLTDKGELDISSLDLEIEFANPSLIDGQE